MSALQLVEIQICFYVFCVPGKQNNKGEQMNRAQLIVLLLLLLCDSSGFVIV